MLSQDSFPQIRSPYLPPSPSSLVTDYHSLEEIRTHCSLAPVPLQALYTPICRFLTWIVVLAIRLAVHPGNQYLAAIMCICVGAFATRWWRTCRTCLLWDQPIRRLWRAWVSRTFLGGAGGKMWVCGERGSSKTIGWWARCAGAAIFGFGVWRFRVVVGKLGDTAEVQYR